MIILDPLLKESWINELFLDNMRTSIQKIFTILLYQEGKLTFVSESQDRLYPLRHDQGSNSRPIERHPCLELPPQLSLRAIARIQTPSPECSLSNSFSAQRRNLPQYAVYVFWDFPKTSRLLNGVERVCRDSAQQRWWFSALTRPLFFATSKQSEALAAVSENFYPNDRISFLLLCYCCSLS
jgi:hypothetical protein